MNKIPKMVSYSDFLKIKDPTKNRPMVFVSDAELKKWCKGKKTVSEAEMNKSVCCKVRLAALPGYGGYVILWLPCRKGWEERWVSTPAGRVKICVPKKSGDLQMPKCGLLFSKDGVSCTGYCEPDNRGRQRRCEFVYRRLGFFCGYEIACYCRGRVPVAPPRPRKTVSKPS